VVDALSTAGGDLAVAGVASGWGGGGSGEREIGSKLSREGSGDKLDATTSSCGLRGDDMVVTKRASSVILLYRRRFPYSGDVRANRPPKKCGGRGRRRAGFKDTRKGFVRSEPR
jgi:hypothetical protein